MAPAAPPDQQVHLVRLVHLDHREVQDNQEIKVPSDRSASRALLDNQELRASLEHRASRVRLVPLEKQASPDRVDRLESEEILDLLDLQASRETPDHKVLRVIVAFLDHQDLQADLDHPELKVTRDTPDSVEDLDRRDLLDSRVLLGTLEMVDSLEDKAIKVDCQFTFITVHKGRLTNAQYTPPMPTGRNCFVASVSAV